MGFSTIGSFIIMFFAVMIMLSSAVLMYSSLAETASTASEMQQERLDNMLNTRIEIKKVMFDNETDPDTTTLYVENTGSKKLDLDYVDAFIDSVKIPRSSQNRSMRFINDSNIINPLHWDAGESIEINISLDLADGGHVVFITTEYGITDSASFTYS